MKILKGDTRIVFLIGRYAFKIARYTTQRLFLQGCIDNISERTFYLTHDRYGVVLKHLLAPSLYCSLFGFIQIQRRCSAINRELRQYEKDIFRDITNDLQHMNFGILNGSVVCFDYA